jgi:3-hydroxyacyl-[acyl-carrier protein] dehydratase / trans-2-decenoyl-[acyl-carrier protein] isomerase
MDEVRVTYFSRQDLLASATGALFDPKSPKLPLPNMLMFDEITRISEQEGAYKRGYVEAKLKVDPDLWFFKCHFQDDPVMPGCLGLDAMWQLVGFYLSWLGFLGYGRALGVGSVKFSGQVLPDAKVVTYQIDIKRLFRNQLPMALADGRVLVDGQTIYVAQQLRVGIMKTNRFHPASS